MSKNELIEKVEELEYLNENLMESNASLSHQYRVLQDNYVKLCMRVNVSHLPKSTPSYYKTKENV